MVAPPVVAPPVVAPDAAEAIVLVDAAIEEIAAPTPDAARKKKRQLGKKPAGKGSDAEDFGESRF